jgi:transcriptional regulator with XRE-family HTH domain
MSTPDRLGLALRLKAARHLAGYERNGRAVPLSVAELVEREPLASNNVRVNRLEEAEQMKVDLRPMELAVIAKALGLPPDWFMTNPDGIYTRARFKTEAIRASLTAADRAALDEAHTTEVELPDEPPDDEDQNDTREQQPPR